MASASPEIAFTLVIVGTHTLDMRANFHGLCRSADCRSGGLGSSRDARISNRDQDPHRQTGQIGSQRNKAIVLARLRKSAFDNCVLAFCEFLLLQPVAEARQLHCIRFQRANTEYADHRHCHLLRPRRERPCRRRAAKQRDERAPP
jgi:hypothetical protein